MILLVSISLVSAITLDELLGGYDWSFNGGDLNVTNYISYGLDTNSNVLYDLIIVNMTVDVTTAGTYTFFGEVGDATTELTTAFSAGISNVPLNFSAKELEQGSYNLSVRSVLNSKTVFEDYDAHQIIIDATYEQYPISITNIVDTAINSDGDGETETLEINVTVNVTEAASYEITAYLSDTTNKTIKASKIHSLNIGISTIDVPFDSRSIRTAHLDGNFTVRLVEIKNTSQEFVKRYVQTHTTNYDINTIDPEGVLITTSFADKGKDNNANTYYDEISLNVTVYSDQAKTVEVEGGITDNYGNFVEEFNKTVSLTTGNNVVEFTLNGKKIYATEINGPYKIGYVNVIDGSNTLDTVTNAYTLQNLSYYTDCERPPKADLTLNISDITLVDLKNGLHNLEVTIHNTGDRTAFEGQINVFNNVSNELRESTVYFIPASGQKSVVFPRIYLTTTDMLSIFVDFNDLVDEKNESNNILKINTTISVSATNTSALEGDAPLLVDFSSAVNKGNGQITYSWDFDNNGIEDSTSANPNYNYTNVGNYTAVLTITDVLGLTATDQITVTVNTPPDLTPPATITGLGETTVTNQTIRWDWTNPTDTDFSHVIVYLDGINIINTTNNYYQATGLQAETSYVISLETVDTNNNINTTIVNDSATTSATTIDTTPPGPITGLTMAFNDDTSIYWLWTDPTDSDFAYSIVYLNGQWKTNTTTRDFYATGLNLGTPYTVSITTIDTNGNTNTNSVNYTQSTTGTAPITPPGTVTGLGETTVTNESIRWNWTNPTDSDFSHVIVSLDGINIINTTNNYYQATGLTPETSYTISTQTVDTVGNINTTTVSDSATTNANPAPDTTPPAPVSNLVNQAVGDDWIYWTWTNPLDLDFDHSRIYIDNVFMTNTANEYYNATGLSSGTPYEIEIETVDTTGNVNINIELDSASTTTPGDTTPPGTVTGLGETTVTNQTIRWDWTNPTDTDFSQVIVIIGGTNVANTTNNYYQATGLTPETSYTISLQTIDTNKNINTNSVSDSATTNANSAGDTTPPGPVTFLGELSVTNETINWDWANPTDPDFSHVIININGINVANTSNQGYTATGLNADTVYTISLQTIDTNGNINTNAGTDNAKTQINIVVIVPDMVYADAGYPLFGTINEVMSFDASDSYGENGITSYEWNFGDSKTGTGITTTHTYTTAGEYDAVLTTKTAKGNSSTDTIKVTITQHPSYNLISYAEFKKTTAQIDLTVKEYGKDNVNGFRQKDNDYTRIEAIVKITGDNDIIRDQIRVYTIKSQYCRPIGNNYFKCLVFDSGVNSEITNTYDHTINIYNDGGTVIDSLETYSVVDESVPTINSINSSDVTNQATININYDLTDYAYLTTDGAGIGKIELYKDSVTTANYLKTEKIDSTSASTTGSFSYDTGVADGIEQEFSFCVLVYDKLRQSTEQCNLEIDVDRKKPEIISLELSKDTVYDGDLVNITVTISEEFADTGIKADLSVLNSKYGNKAADSCRSLSGSTQQACEWQNIELDISASKTVNIKVDVTDDAGNSNTATISKQLTLGNRNPVLTVSDMTVDEGAEVVINAQTSDPDGDSVTLSYTGWMTKNKYNATYSDAGEHTVTVKADDGKGGIVTKDITITVNDKKVADLKIQDVFLIDGFSPVIAEFTIKNIGEAKADSVRWTIESENAQAPSDGGGFSLGIGEEITIYSFIQYSKTGKFPLTIKIDPNNNIAELNESNNEYSKEVNV